MTSDARAICAAILLSQNQQATTVEEAAQKIAGAVRAVEVLETALAGLPKDDAERGIRGMIPVGLVKTWLEGLRARLEAAQPQNPKSARAYEDHEMIGEFLAYLGRCLAQLENL